MSQVGKPVTARLGDEAQSHKPADPALVKRLRELLEKATPGPWHALPGPLLGLYVSNPVNPAIMTELCWAADEEDDPGRDVIFRRGGADEVLIAEAITALPKLLDALEGNEIEREGIVLSRADYEALQQAIDEAPQRNEKLSALLKSKTPWGNEIERGAESHSSFRGSDTSSETAGTNPASAPRSDRRSDPEAGRVNVGERLACEPAESGAGAVSSRIAGVQSIEHGARPGAKSHE